MRQADVMVSASTVVRRFPISFTGPNRAMALIGITPRTSWVDVGTDTLTVQLSWAFRLRATRRAVRSVAPDHGRVGGWGAHGWRGRWLVNGSSQGLVRIEFDAPFRAFVMGFPVRVHTLRVSVVDPDGLCAALV
jgi:hypothetical protein